MADHLTRVLSLAKELSDEDFNNSMGAFNFEYHAEGSEDSVIEICEGGKNKALTKENAPEYVRLLLKAVESQDRAQFLQLQSGFEYVLTRQLAVHMSSTLASKMATGVHKIEMEDLKQAIRVNGSKKYKKMLFDCLADFTN